jgi:hypothetical protein
MKSTAVGFRSNAKLARQLWGLTSGLALRSLRELTARHRLSVAEGDLQFLDGRWYITHSGLLRLASRRKCRGISTSLQARFCDPATNRWVFRAVVYKGPKSKGFVGYADADPSNVSSLMHGAEMRVAETRATNRALRKAYGIGLCSVEELGAFSNPHRSSASGSSSNGSGRHSSNGAGKSQPRLRDQLCLLIRQFNLDPNLVKTYAADFCGTQALGEASRESVESFISHLSAAAKENKEALLCKLNSYAQPVEAKS